MEKSAFEAMKFGSENDLKKALTELRVIQNTNGQISERDFESVSVKYLFPIDFLKKGLEGFSYPDDWLISKSKWFHILYSWIAKDKQRSMALYRLQFSYVWARTAEIMGIGFSLVIGFYLEFTLYLFKVSLQGNFVIIFPYVLFLIPLWVTLVQNVSYKQAKMDDYSQQLRDEGLGYIVKRNERFVIKHYQALLFGLGKMLLRKLDEPNIITVIPAGTEEKDKEPSNRVKMLSRIHLIPKSFAQTKTEKVPIFYGEDSILEYRKRIQEISKQNKNSVKKED